jgi:RNA polymerase sigma-70 factor (ECF subfamily)
VNAEDLIHRARKGDLNAFEELLRMHERRVFSLAYRMMGNVPDAQDAAQEVYLRLYKGLRSIQEGRELQPWLNRVTANICTDLLRRRRKLIPIDLLALAAEEQFDREEQRAMVAAALETLPSKQRQAILLRDVEGLSTAEVATTLGSSETTVRSQISTGRARMRDWLLRRKP